MATVNNARTRELFFNIKKQTPYLPLTMIIMCRVCIEYYHRRMNCISYKSLI